MQRQIRAIRLSEEELQEALKKGATYGMDELSTIVRLAIKQLRPMKK